MPSIYKIFFSVSIFIILGSLAVFLTYGLNLGIDFTGGSLLEVRPARQQPEPQAMAGGSGNLDVNLIRESLESLNIQNTVVSQAGDSGFLIRMPEISEENHQQILAEFRKSGEIEEIRFDSIGSTIGAELKRKSIISIIIALIAISLYLAVMFGRIGKVINPLVLALGAVVALLHDLLLPIGVFSWLGQFRGVSIDAPLIAAALAILGYSINDTVVVYDRIRENVLKNPDGDFNSNVHRSVKQILARSINTTLTTLFAVIAIYIFGGETLKNFSLALIIGISAGAYSSIFVASPILMFLHRRR